MSLVPDPSRPQVRVESLQKEKTLLRQTEGRLVQEKEAMLAEQRNQNLLLTNLKSIQVHTHTYTHTMLHAHTMLHTHTHTYTHTMLHTHTMLCTTPQVDKGTHSGLSILTDIPILALTPICFVCVYICVCV